MRKQILNLIRHSRFLPPILAQIPIQKQRNFLTQQNNKLKVGTDYKDNVVAQL